MKKFILLPNIILVIDAIGLTLFITVLMPSVVNSDGYIPPDASGWLFGGCLLCIFVMAISAAVAVILACAGAKRLMKENFVESSSRYVGSHYETTYQNGKLITESVDDYESNGAWIINAFLWLVGFLGIISVGIFIYIFLKIFKKDI